MRLMCLFDSIVWVLLWKCLSKYQRGIVKVQAIVRLVNILRQRFGTFAHTHTRTQTRVGGSHGHVTSAQTE